MDYQKESERHFKERKSQQNEHGPIILLILDPGLSEGVLCNHPCLSVCQLVRQLVRPSLNISETTRSIM